MSADNVELVRDALADVVETQRASGAAAPGFVWDMTTFEDWPEQNEFHGVDAFNEFLRRWVEPYDEWTLEVEELHEVADDQVVAVLRQRGRLRDSAAQVEMHYGIVYTVQGRQLQRAQVYATPEEALSSVGLPAERS
jgi:ketosteroid isomerase-like protein